MNTIPRNPSGAKVGTITAEQVIVAIPTLNEKAHIERCLRSLIDGEAFCAEVQFVVVDGGSTDRTREIVAELSAHYNNIELIHNPDKLQSAGINRVASECGRREHEILVRCDAHAAYPPGYIRRVVAAFETLPDAASVTGVLDARGNNCFQKAAAWAVDTRLGSGGSGHRGGSVSKWVDHGHHAGFRLSWFQQLGGYDPTFSHNEDAEYDMRLTQAGGRVWLDHNLRVDYVMRPSWRKLFLQYWRYGKGRARTCLKHNIRPGARQVIPTAALILQIVSLIVGLVQPWALVVPALYLSALLAVSLAATAQLRSLCGLWAGAALFAIHNAWAGGFLYGLAMRREPA